MEKPTQNGGDSDQDFDPSADMLVNDFDNEETLEEEEAMESGESVGNELDELQKEGEMPLDDLLAMYGLGNNTTEAIVTSTSKKEPLTVKNNPPSTPVRVPTQHLPPPPILPLPPPIILQPEVVVKPIEVPIPPVKAIQPLPDEKVSPKIVEKQTPPVECGSVTRHLLRACKSVSQPSESSASDSDDDGSPDDDWRKTIQVGSDYQAQIPEGLCKYDGAPAYENEDRLLWDPTKLGDEEVEEYLRQAQMPHSSSSSIEQGGIYALPNGCHIRDDEQALYLLLQCGHNMEEALRRKRMQPHATGTSCFDLLGTKPETDTYGDTMSLWSEEECRSFENGLRTYGKDFHLIQLNKVRTRAVGELVQFYYLWKKTERHDVFASKTRLEKKKYALHPGTTDYMDRFLDEQENPSTPRDRSSSPNMQSLLYGDGRKQVSSSTGSSARPGSTSSPTNSNFTQAAHQQKNHPQSDNSPKSNSTLNASRSPSTTEVKNSVRDSGGIVNGIDKSPNVKNRNWQQTQHQQSAHLVLSQHTQPKDNSVRNYPPNASGMSNILLNESSFSSSLQDNTVSSGN